jgi:hypothetical protein
LKVLRVMSKHPGDEDVVLRGLALMRNLSLRPSVVPALEPCTEVCQRALATFGSHKQVSTG